MSLHKSTWNEFISEARAGLAYGGSGTTKSLSELASLTSEWEATKLIKDRTYIKGTKVLQFKTDRETISRLDRKGRVWATKQAYFIVDGDLIVVYGRVANK